ncbi:DMT family transporter [Photobacterium damselae]|uniref:DMT family transporter n=1 Tax=Photobacterium damselae TaxID=38293 RepID=UPI0030F36ECD
MRKLNIVVLFICVCLIWGSTWFAMEIAVQAMSSPMVNALRFAIASPIVILIAKFYGKPLLFPIGTRRWMVPISLAYFTIPFTLMTYGELYISPGLSAIIFSLMPLAIMAISRLFTPIYLSKMSIGGLLLSIVCLSLIIKFESNFSQTNYAYIGVISLISALSLHAIVYVASRHKLKDINVLTFNALPALFASFTLFLFSCINNIDNLSNVTLYSISAIIYLALIGSVIGIIAYCRLNQLVLSFTASLCFLIFPLVSLFISTIIEENMISPPSLLVLPVYLFGIFLIIKSQQEVSS